jgi:hypothetical protein
MVIYGFRALGSTALNEAGFQPDVVEAYWYILAWRQFDTRGL